MKMTGDEDMWIRCLVCNLRSKRALAVGFCGGVVGVLIGLDHPLAYWIFEGHPTFAQWRFWHIPLAVVAFAVACCCVAYIGGLFCRVVLKR